jgi:DNA polymerase alpha subunit A
MQKMFQSATVKRPTKAAAVDDAATEALLDDILGDIDSGEGGEAVTPNLRARAAPLVQPRPVANYTPQQPSAGPPRLFSRPGRPGGIQVAPGPAQRHRLALSTKAEIFQLPVAAATPVAGAGGGDAVPMDYAGGDDDFGFGDDYADDEGAAASPPAAAASRPDVKQQDPSPQEVTSLNPAPVVAAAAAAAAPSSSALASGWGLMYQEGPGQGATTEGGGTAEMEEAATEEEQPWQDDGSLPLDTESCLPFYLIDAHEEMAQPGTVFLFGKVPTSAEPQAQHVSCCAVVRNIQRSVFFVPREEVGDEEIARLHAAASAGDADAKKQLIPLLHVRPAFAICCPSFYMTTCCFLSSLCRSACLSA